MAKIQEEIVVIKVSQLLRDDETAEDLLNVDDLEAVIKELTGGNALVEVSKD